MVVRDDEASAVDVRALKVEADYALVSVRR